MLERTMAAMCGAVLLACSGGDSAGGSNNPPVGPPPPAPVASVAVSLGATSVMAGQTTQATAQPRDAAGNTLNGRAVTWSSSAPAVATVSTSGLVSAVSAGTANIVATSEGQSGTATLTVTPDPAAAVTLQLQGLTSGGQALDVANAAGLVDLTLDATVPAGTSGTLTVTVGGIEFHRSTVSPSLADAVTSAPRSVSINLADYTVNAVGERVRTTALRNGTHDLVVRLDAMAGGQLVSRQAVQRITATQVDAFVGVLSVTGTSVVSGGKTWEKGELRLVPVFVSYSGGGLEEARFVIGDAPTQPGGYAQARTVREVTRSGTALDSAIRVADWTGESPAGGTQVWLAGYRVAGVAIDPRAAVPNANGTCAALDRRGFASTAPSGPLPAGCTRFQLVPPLDGKLSAAPLRAPSTALATAHRPITSTLYLDHQGPTRLANGAFTLRSRVLTVGQPATDAAGDYGVSDNWVIPGYRLGTGWDAAKVTDGGSGMDAASFPSFYVGTQTTASALKVPANLAGPASEVPATVAITTNFALASIADRLGNTSDFWLETTTANPFTDGVVRDATPNDGTRAVLRVVAPGGSATWTGVATGLWTRSTNPGFQLSATFSGSAAGYPNNFAALLATHTASNGTVTRLAGSGTVPVPTIVSSTGGTTGTVTVPFAQLVGAAPGNKEGTYRFRLCGADHAGVGPINAPLASIGAAEALAAPGDGCTAEREVSVDVTAPTTSGEVFPAQPFGGTSPQTFGALLADGGAVAQGIVGAEYRSFVHSGWDAGYVYLPFAWQLYANALLLQSFAPNAIAPWVIWLLSSNGSFVPGSPAYQLSHLYYQSYDRAGNTSARRSLAVSQGLLPAVPANPFAGLMNGEVEVTPRDVCIALSLLACSAHPVVANYAFRLLAQFQQPLFEYVVVFALLQNGATRPLCLAALQSVILVGTLYQQQYSCSYNWQGNPLVTTGQILIAMMGVTRLGYGGKHGRFLTQNLYLN